jgi:hypothetical protein
MAKRNMDLQDAILRAAGIPVGKNKPPLDEKIKQDEAGESW